uniref:Glyco_hydro_32N domain-containing protein n=1 Tax=Globodera pallida TaxID=36090 RepID=A0A183C3Y4_GLOPA
MWVQSSWLVANLSNISINSVVIELSTVPGASAKNMMPLLLAFLFVTSLFLIHGTEGAVIPVNVLLHDATSTLHVWVRPVKKGEVAKVYLCPPTEAGTIKQSGQLIAECKQYSSDLWHDFIEINNKAAGAYTLTWTETTQASLVYVFEPKTVLEEGIRILFIVIVDIVILAISGIVKKNRIVFCASAKNMLASLFAFLFATSLFLIHGTEGAVIPVNVLLHDATSTLHVWVRPVKKGEVAKVYLCPPTEAGTIKQSGHLIAECKQYSSDLWHEFVEINDKAAGAYTLTWTETTQASLVYVFEPKTVLEEGIRILFIGEDAKLPNFKGSYHFRAPFGWNSDPCGFNRSKDGLYHLFYQHFPHSVQWYTMHWGHAVSKDLINWIHLPIFMIPPNLVHLDAANGHFTGSSINLPNGEFGVFWTQRITDFPTGTVAEYPWREVQQYDLIRPDWTTHKTIIEGFPTDNPPLGTGFRDPVVFLGPGGYYYMTVGGERKDGGVVLLYKNKNKRADQLDRDWEYQGVLYEDKRDGLRVCECPLLIALGDPLKRF